MPETAWAGVGRHRLSVRREHPPSPWSRPMGKQPWAAWRPSPHQEQPAVVALAVVWRASAAICILTSLLLGVGVRKPDDGLRDFCPMRYFCFVPIPTGKRSVSREAPWFVVFPLVRPRETPVSSVQLELRCRRMTGSGRQPFLLRFSNDPIFPDLRISTGGAQRGRLSRQNR